MASKRDALPFVFRGDDMLVSENGDGSGVLPSIESVSLDSAFRQEVGVLDGRSCVAVDASPEAEAPEGTAFRNLLELSASLDDRYFPMAGRAKQIVAWNRETRFCGRCGAEPERVERFEKRCPRCGMMFHPRISPAMIVRVHRGDEILLARSPGFPPKIYSVLAGFVEPGESIEDTVRREVTEEVGVEVGNIEYFGNQPWPFPNSLMIGFTAEYVSGEIEIDENEIEDAGWYTAENHPPLPPRLSIARTMIEDYLGRFGD
ncbi:MAG: NAD(+) diphosphatase [Rubrobacter sp.]|jgi:NAD+ diphosphatase|nr:NAD(+) diphosphatase [Rubrobacter sp.]